MLKHHTYVNDVCTACGFVRTALRYTYTCQGSYRPRLKAELRSLRALIKRREWAEMNARSDIRIAYRKISQIEIELYTLSEKENP